MSAGPDLRRDWRLYLQTTTRPDLIAELGATHWQYVEEGTLAALRRARDLRFPGNGFWLDWSIRRPESGRPT